MTEIALRQEQPSTALARTDASMRLVEWAQEAQAANRLAAALCKTPFAGQFRGDQDGATAAILRGHEMGLTPVTALAAFDLIQGQPAPKAMTLRALVQAAGHHLEIVHSDEERAVARYRRRDEPEWKQTEFTIADAQRMGLTGKDNWKKQPRAMLEARVTARAARLVAADVILGIGYSAEELRDGDVPAVTVVQGQRVTAAEIAGPAVSDTYEPSEPEAQPEETPAEPATRAQLTKLHAALGNLGITERDGALAFCGDFLGRVITTTKDLSKSDASAVIDHAESLRHDASAEPEPDDDGGWPDVVQPGTAGEQ